MPDLIPYQKIQQASTTLPQTKKWYRHKIVLAIILLALMTGIAIGVYFKFYVPKNLKPAADTCIKSTCWGHLGCNYYTCTKTDGSTYIKFEN